MLIPGDLEARNGMESVNGVSSFVSRVFAVAALLGFKAQMNKFFYSRMQQVFASEQADGCTDPETITTIWQLSHSPLHSNHFNL